MDEEQLKKELGTNKPKAWPRVRKALIQLGSDLVFWATTLCVAMGFCFLALMAVASMAGYSFSVTLTKSMSTIATHPIPPGGRWFGLAMVVIGIVGSLGFFIREMYRSWKAKKSK